MVASARKTLANLAVGSNHIVQGVNSSYAVFSKTGTVLAGPTKFATLFSKFGGCQNTHYSDPTLQYDRQADRWVLSILAYASASSGHYCHCIAVPTTGDPTGSCARYAYSFFKFSSCGSTLTATNTTLSASQVARLHTERRSNSLPPSRRPPLPERLRVR
jgi:hypothetical protein